MPALVKPYRNAALRLPALLPFPQPATRRLPPATRNPPHAACRPQPATRRLPPAARCPLPATRHQIAAQMIPFFYCRPRYVTRAICSCCSCRHCRVRWPGRCGSDRRGLRSGKASGSKPRCWAQHDVCRGRGVVVRVVTGHSAGAGSWCTAISPGRRAKLPNWRQVGRWLLPYRLSVAVYLVLVLTLSPTASSLLLACSVYQFSMYSF
jgi:hypothetical protein